MAPEVRHFASVSGLLGSTRSPALKINPKNVNAQLNTGNGKQGQMEAEAATILAHGNFR